MASIFAKEALEEQSPKKFQFKDRGEINVKGKGAMRVFGLLGKTGEPRYTFDPLHADDEVFSDKRSEVYTPIDDANSRLSSIGRLSVTQS